MQDAIGIFFLIFWLRHAGMLVPLPGTELDMPPAVKAHGVLTTGPLGKTLLGILEEKIRPCMIMNVQ